MKININQTITNVLDENRNIISSKTVELFVIYPAEGKALRNKTTGDIIKGFVCVHSKSKISNFEEIPIADLITTQC